MTLLPQVSVGAERLWCDCDILRAAYRRGYNDHARTVQHWQDTHGAYRQHGEGENP